MEVQYFGKGCEYLCGKWEDDDKESEPLINACNHPDNANIYEGACNKRECPLKKRECPFKRDQNKNN